MADWFGDTGQGVAKGAAIGATLGTVVPGVGNVIGGAVGAVGGGLLGLARNLFPETVSGLLDGPQGAAVAPLVERTIREVTGTDEPGVVLERLAENPSLSHAIEARFNAMVEMDRIAAEDRANARQMYTVSAATGNRTADRLAWAILGSFAVVAVMILAGAGLLISGVGGPRANTNPEVWVAVSGIVGAILGYFSSNAQNVVNFYFSSSASSGRKDGLIGGLLEQQQGQSRPRERRP